MVLKAVLVVGITAMNTKGFKEHENKTGYQNQGDKYFKTEGSFCFSDK